MEKAKVFFEVKIVRKLPVAQKYRRQISRKKIHSPNSKSFLVKVKIVESATLTKKYSTMSSGRFLKNFVLTKIQDTFREEKP